MKKIVLFITIKILFGDINNVILLIKNMENFKPRFKKIEQYKPFFNEEKIKKEKIIVTKQNTNVNLSVSAIFQNKALINGKWVKVGNIIEGYKVIKISDNKIILSKNEIIKVIMLTSKILKVKK